MTSSSSNCSSDDDVCSGKRIKRKRREQPNKDIKKGGIDGIQEGTLIHLTSMADLPLFNAYIQHFPVVACFTGGTWCGPAREMNDLMIELSDHYITLTFIKIDLSLENHSSEMSKFMSHFDIQGLPTFLFFYEGNQVYKLAAPYPDELMHLTHSLYRRQTLLRIKGLKAELAKTIKEKAAAFHIERLRDNLSRAEASAGVELELYKPTKVLEVEDELLQS